MWEINEGDMKSLYAMKVMQPKGLGFQMDKVQVSRILNTSSPKWLTRTTNTLEHALPFGIGMINEQV